MLLEIKKEALADKLNKSTWLRASYDHMKVLCQPLMLAQRPYDIQTKEAIGSAARSYGARMTMLITAGMEDQVYTDKAKDMLMFAVETTDLAYYEQLNGHLAVADAAFTYGVCYDLLQAHLDESEQKLVLEAIKELGKYLYECNTTWGLPHAGVSSCNHNSVHYGALGICALTLGQASWLEIAVKRVKDFFANAIDETGYITEGVSYAFYGLTNALVFSEAYYNDQGIDLVKDYPTIKEIPNQFIEHMLPSYDSLLSLNDHYKYVGNSAPLIYLVSRFGYSEALYLWETFERKHGTYGSGEENYFRQGMAFPFLIHWANPDLPSVKPSLVKRPLSKKFHAGRVMMRTAWDEEMATFVSFTSGKDFHRGHNHPDQNAFTVHALGEDFLIDPGRIGKDSRSHNIVMVNGYGQQFGTSRGEIRAFKDYGRYAQVTGDATEAYEWVPETLVGYAARHMTFIRYPYPIIVIRDDIQTEHGQEKFYEFMLHTEPENTFYQKGSAVYIKGHHHQNLCRVSMVHPESTQIKLFDQVERQVHHYKANHALSKWHKEALISTTAVNPFFTTVITFGESESVMPEISYDGQVHDLNISLRFKDGYTERINVERHKINVINGYKDNKSYQPW